MNRSWIRFRELFVHNRSAASLTQRTQFVFRGCALLSIIVALLALTQTIKSGSRRVPTSAHAVPETYFCLTVQNATTTTPWPTVPFAGIRTWDSCEVSWSELNPARGVYDWRHLDALLKLAQSHNVDILYTFGRTPRWASENPDQKCGYDPGACLPPAKLEDWDNFVRAISTHAEGRIKYWEMWNEPNQHEYWSGDVATLVTMAEHAYRIVKSIDPSAQILSPSAVGGIDDTPDWMSQYFRAGGGPVTDIVAFHGYGKNPAVPEYVVPLIDAVRGVTKQYGQNEKPLWDTEASWGPVNHLPDLDDQIAFVARHYILQWSEGVQRYYWYAWDDESYGTMWERQGNLRKTAVAYQQVHDWLVGAQLVVPCEEELTSRWTCQLSRAGRYSALLVWNTEGQKEYTPPSRFVQLRNLEGETIPIHGSVVIGKQPVLLESELVRQ